MLQLAMRSPSFFSDSVAAALFENHWLIWISILAVGGLFLYLGMSRANRRLQFAGLALTGGSLLLILAALLFVTPAERLYAVHADLANAVQANDVDRILSHLNQNFRAEPLGLHFDDSTRADISAYLKEYAIKNTAIRSYTSTHRNGAAFTTINLLTDSQFGPTLTRWELSWDDPPNDDWKITLARLTHLNNNPLSQNIPLR